MPPLIYKENGHIEEIKSVRDYLLTQNNSSLYTTMRMNSETKTIFQFEMHLNRLKADEQEKNKIEEILKRLTNLEASKNDLRITVIRQDTGAFEVILEEMPMVNISSCQVEIKFAQRQNVQEKSSHWVKCRKELEDSKLPGTNEIILADEAGCLYEGLSSNFFIITGEGSLQTAPLDQVLTGTVMKRVFEIWSGSVVFEKPDISDIKNWRGAFITSTSRLILPIDTVIFEDQKFNLPIDDLIKNLKNELFNNV